MPNAPTARKPRRWGWWLLLAFVLVIAVALFTPLLLMRIGVKPLVFNESFFGHSHCIKIIGLTFNTYANDNAGKFPAHINGYGDALLLMLTDVGSPKMLTGPCYSEAVFEKAIRDKSDVAEAECGRVYVQGLAEDANPELFLLFDKQPTHGGDHYHGWGRLSAALGRGFGPWEVDTSSSWSPSGWMLLRSKSNFSSKPASRANAPLRSTPRSPNTPPA